MALMGIKGLRYGPKQTKYLCVTLLDCLQISRNKRQKMNSQLSAAYLRCKMSVDTYTPCIWSCPKMQAYWMDVLLDLEI